MFGTVGEGLYGIAAVCAAGTILFTLIGEKKPMTPPLRFLWSMILLLMFFSPLLSARDALEGLLCAGGAGDTVSVPEEADGVSEFCAGSALAAAEDTAEALLKTELRMKTGIPEDAFFLRLTLEEADGEVVVTNVTAVLEDKRYRMMREKVSAILTELLGCPCRAVFLQEHGNERGNRDAFS